MARVTVEDCIVKIPNRFELTLIAGQRARALAGGAPLAVERDNDKNPVVALREIADGAVDIAVLREDLIRGLQKHVEVDEPVEDAEQIALEENISTLAGAGEKSEAPAGEPEGDELAEEAEDLEALVEEEIASEMGEFAAGPEKEPK